MEVKIINKSNYQLPKYAKEGDSGADLRANIEESITIKPLDRFLIPTGIYIELPKGYEVQIRPRSGLSAKFGIVAALGTIDSGYRGELKVILMNLSNEEFTVHPGDRVAQMVCAKVEKMDFIEVDSLYESERGEGGFNSSGIR